MAKAKLTSIDQIKFDKRNARKHPERNLDVIETSMRERGAARSIVVDEDGRLIAGEGAVRAAKRAGIKRIIPVETDGQALVAVVRSGLSESEKMRLAIEDNRANELSEWDAEMFQALPDSFIDSLQQDDLWTEVELAPLLFTTDGETEEVETKTQKSTREIQNKWKVRSGDTYRVGRHYVICADSSTLRDEFAEKLGGRHGFDGVCTDPPYDLSAKEVVYILEGCADRAIVLCADKLAFDLARLWQFRLDLIWKHADARLLGVKLKDGTRTMPIFHHVHCLVIARDAKCRTGWRRPSPTFGSIIELSYEDHKFGYGKPVELFKAMLAGFPWRTVCDPFLGSGGVLLACEAQNRKCVGVEKEPSTLAVALERFQEAGLKITKAGS